MSLPSRELQAGADPAQIGGTAARKAWSLLEALRSALVFEMDEQPAEIVTVLLYPVVKLLHRGLL